MHSTNENEHYIYVSDSMIYSTKLSKENEVVLGLTHATKIDYQKHMTTSIRNVMAQYI